MLLRKVSVSLQRERELPTTAGNHGSCPESVMGLRMMGHRTHGTIGVLGARHLIDLKNQK